MLVTNQRLDKLAASCVDFAGRGMLKGTCLAEMLHKFSEYYAAVWYTHTDKLMCSGLKSSIDGEDNTIRGPMADVADNNNDNNNNDEGPVAGTRVLATVKIAKTISK
jgi:hypothetical protein